MASLRLRDRDAIVTEEGLIFRVLGYMHPPQSFICDVEYAPSSVFKSDNPKALRSKAEQVFYKFYEDEGWRFLKEHYPQYLIFDKQLQKKIVGVETVNVEAVRKPEKQLAELLATEIKDSLISSTSTLLEFVTKESNLSVEDFGIFGSLMHDFHHPSFSDIDVVIYGRDNFARLRKTLERLYTEKNSNLSNEFEAKESIKAENWRFSNYSFENFVRHQKRKLIYGVYNSGGKRETVKVEFEPVKAWPEITDRYDPELKIEQRGWVKMVASIKDDDDGPFIPSIYIVEPVSVLSGSAEAIETRRVLSYLEEFRLQAQEGERVYVEGNLERVVTSNEDFFQVALTYCPRYYEQALKVLA